MIHTWEGLEKSLSMLYEVIHPFTVESANIRSTLRCSVYRRSTASNTAAPGKLHLVRPTPGLIGIDPSHFSISNTCRGISAVPKIWPVYITYCTSGVHKYQVLVGHGHYILQDEKEQFEHNMLDRSNIMQSKEYTLLQNDWLNGC